MDENQKPEEKTIIEKECGCSHPVWKCILTGLLIFAGAFCAFYTVADWHFKTMLRPDTGVFPAHMDRMMRKEMRLMDNMFEQEGRMSKKAGNIIHLKQTKDFYKVVIDLRAFDNNENNVQVSTNGSILTINGRSIRKGKHNEQISEFQQQYMFGQNVKLDELTKSTEGNYFIITIPIAQDEED